MIANRVISHSLEADDKGDYFGASIGRSFDRPNQVLDKILKHHPDFQ